MNPQTIAHLYDQRTGLFDPRDQIDDVRNSVAIIRSICPSPKTRILDVGCGEGHHLIEMAAAGYTGLHGVDISQYAIDTARARCQDLPISFTCADISNVKLGEFDLVVAFNSSLGSFGIGGDYKYLCGIEKAMRSGGRLLLCYISLDAARRRVGTFHSRSARDRDAVITTRVSISRDSRWMTLNQVYLGEDLPAEHIRIFDGSEISSIIGQAGLTRVDLDSNHQRSLPFVTVLLAVKPYR